MKARSKDVKADIRFGAGVVTIRRHNASATECGLLGAVPVKGMPGLVSVVLDRRIHDDDESAIGGYPVDGPVVTVMTVPATDLAPGSAVTA